MTYAKALPAASQPLTGRSGAHLVATFRRGRSKKRGACAALFLEGSQLDNATIIAHIGALSPAIIVVIRDYRKTHPRMVETLERVSRMQRRTVFTARAAKPGQGEHCPRWKRPPAKGRRRGLLSMSVHNAAEAIRARKAKADVVFISPVFKTQSHPGLAPLSPFQARRLVGMAKTQAFALGGINAATITRLTSSFAGFASVSSLLKDD